MRFPQRNVKPISVPINTLLDTNTCSLDNLQEVSSDNYYGDYHKALTFCLLKKHFRSKKKINIIFAGSSHIHRNT